MRNEQYINILFYFSGSKDEELVKHNQPSVSVLFVKIYFVKKGEGRLK